MNENNHVSDQELMTFQQNRMNQQDMLSFLEHISSCNYCSDRFAAMMSEELIPAPKDLKASILRATKKPEVILAAKVKETTKRMQLFIYSLKIGTAMILALLLLTLSTGFTGFSNASNFISKEAGNSGLVKENVPLAATIRDNMDNLSTSILNFSNNIINMEVSHHD